MYKYVLLAVLGLVACNEAGVEVTQPDSDASTLPDASAEADVAEVAADIGADSAIEPQSDAGGTVDTGTDAGTDANLPIDMAPSTNSPGCVGGAGIPEGENTFTLEGLDRRYIMRLPANYSPDRAWPLVLALHGNGGNTSYWDGESGERNIRGVLQNDAILVVAEAIDNQWRDYSMDASTFPARIEMELNYFDKIIGDVSNELCVDESAIFSMGFSGGGSFSGVLGCRRTDIRAIAVGGSVVYFNEDNCVGKPAAWIAISEGDLSAGREAYRDYFRDVAGCDATSTATTPNTCVAYDNCDDGTPVHFCNHPGGHIWPDYGSQAMWDFFSQFVTTQ